MPGFHPLYRDASAELLSFVDHHCGHGLFRNWAAFTRTVLDVVGGEEPDQGGGGQRLHPAGRGQRCLLTAPTTASPPT